VTKGLILRQSPMSFEKREETSGMMGKIEKEKT